MLSRRSFLAGSAQLAVLAHLPPHARAARERDARMVLMILRGGLDGLAAVAPYGESRYQSIRGELALDSSGSDGLKPLNGLFAMHPALQNMHRLYEANELAVVHAVATPYRERSHFDGQKVLENGADTANELRDGWLNRTLAALNAGATDSAIAMANNIPLVLRGDVSVSTWAPSALPEASGETLRRVADLYANDPHLSARLAEALQAREIAGGMEMGNRRRGGRGQLGPLVSAAGRFLSADDGPRIAVLESGGWDTHANQGSAQGALAGRLRGLDNSLDTLKRELGEHWDTTVVIIATEFGRTVAVNGTRGTDHGTAGCAFVAGGAVRGGQVVADWPGLGQRDLYEGRDLKPTMDLRTLFKGVLQEHMGVAASALDRSVFPDSGSIKALEGLVEA